MITLSEDEVLILLRKEIGNAGSQKEFARRCALSAAYINDVLHGRRALTDSVLGVIGVERQVIYRVKDFSS